MASPNTIALRRNQFQRRDSYLGPYNHVRADGNIVTQRHGWTPGKLITSRDGSTTYQVAHGGNLVRVR